MVDDPKEPTGSEILAALQGMWRQQKDLIQGVEGRLGAKVDSVEGRLGARIDTVEGRLRAEINAVEERLGDRLAREIQDRPIVVHVDMSRVSELEKQVQELVRRVSELEARH